MVRVPAVLLIGIVTSISWAGDANFDVHEWGTFTVLQDERGRELPGINIDDEPVPEFVHDLAPYLLTSPFITGTHRGYQMKGAPRHHPAVTMRLETPVIYFHPHPGAKLPRKIDVQATFRGGWLTQFYPQADFATPGYAPGKFDFRKLTPATESTLTWRELQIGTQDPGPETTDPVWLSPRKVHALDVTNRDGESERYLFYRGVAQLRAPLRIELGRDKRQLTFYGNFAGVLKDRPTTLGDVWLVRVNERGQCAYRRLDALEVDGRDDVPRLTTSYRFEATSGTDQKSDLEREMHAALVKDGLHADEATALLTTWQRAYFASPGLRVFYLVPRAWTDHYLPLTITGNPATVRTMVGRIELIGDELRERLTRLSRTAPSSQKWLTQMPESPAKDAFFEGRSFHGDLGVEIPADYKLYLSLGRFRNALVTAEEARTKSTNLRAFVENYGLQPFRPGKDEE